MIVFSLKVFDIFKNSETNFLNLIVKLAPVVCIGLELLAVHLRNIQFFINMVNLFQNLSREVSTHEKKGNSLLEFLVVY